MTELSVREANGGDSRDVFDWRNDEFTRSMSRDSKPLAWEDHARWFEQTLHRADSLMLIFEDANSRRKIGVVRFDLASNGSRSEISINIAPHMRGMGYGTSCLKRAITCLQDRYPACKAVLAEIKNTNEGSKKSFERAGFTFTSEGVSFCQYQYDC